MGQARSNQLSWVWKTVTLVTHKHNCLGVDFVLFFFFKYDSLCLNRDLNK